MKIESLYVILLLALSACGSRSSLEHQLIGTWTTPQTTMIEYDANGKATNTDEGTVEITFTKDHKEFRSTNGKATSVSRWRLEGNDLITAIEQPTDTYGPIQQREKISSITSHELVLSDGHSEGRWTRVR